MKIDVTEEQLIGHSRAVRRGALEGTAAGLLFSGAVSYYAHRRLPAYRTLPLSLKALGPVILIAPLLSIQAERRSLEYDESQWTGEGLKILNEKERKVNEKWDAMTPQQKLGDWASRHEYSLIMGSWALSLGLAGALISRDKYQTPSQKVVQARMWAQGLTIGILIAAGALKHSQRSEAADRHVDHSWRDVLAQQERESAVEEEARSGLSAATRRSVSSL
ncbi:hypothetical protein J3R30DRAFT_3474211 [Lentinula aciculospora]|uniref:HIG1 domain-containing protein n=1 Tax=Lentinula aciculospora TaxID=153920 RepID=A0A9W9ABY1_9AGAR|nr:hypothetical protein J3R30DRAFT_3474211 [Lentinula aciculospora]